MSSAFRLEVFDVESHRRPQFDPSCAIEVVHEGSASQKQEARRLIESLPG